MGPLAAVNVRDSPALLGHPCQPLACAHAVLVVHGSGKTPGPCRSSNHVLVLRMCAEDELDLSFDAEECSVVIKSSEAQHVAMHKPVAVRPPMPSANTQWQLASKDARKANERENASTGEQTPRVAAARRDLYERVDRQSQSIAYVSSDDGSHLESILSILSGQETASGSTSAAVRWQHGSRLCTGLCMVFDASARGRCKCMRVCLRLSSPNAYVWVRTCTSRLAKCAYRIRACRRRCRIFHHQVHRTHRYRSRGSPCTEHR